MRSGVRFVAVGAISASTIGGAMGREIAVDAGRRAFAVFGCVAQQLAIFAPHWRWYVFSN